MIVNRGPQFVQLMKGYRNLRSRGFISSRKQSSQTLTSGDISARAAAPVRLATIRNSVSGCGSASRSASTVIFDRGGTSFGSRSKNLSTASVSPCTSMLTPAGELAIKPVKPHSFANL
jgi:hypothetical protein